MKFYIFKKESLSYIRFRFFRPKLLLYFFVIQICITVSFLFSISSFYDTPKEKKLKEDISYLLIEFNEINKRIIESEAILQEIKEKDSIIYKSIFDIENITRKDFEVYYDDLSAKEYSTIVNETNERISRLNSKLDKELYIIQDIEKTAYSHQEMLTHLPAIQPIDNKDLRKTASGWGYRIHPIYKIKKFHYGIDFTAPIGTPIYSTADGEIQYIIKNTDKASKGYGNLIIIDHGYGYRTLYAHMQKFGVKQGETVKRGEIIGYVGNTGLSTGPHLHYEVIKNGRKVNPVHYFFNDLSPEDYQKIIEISNSINQSYD